MPHAHLADCPASHGRHCTCEERRYWRIFWLILAVCGVEIAGGFYSGSIALFSDSGHMALDATSPVISIYVARKVHRSLLGHADEHALRLKWMRRSGWALLLALFAIGYESVVRFKHPDAVAGLGVMLAAGIAVAGNLWQHSLLPHEHNVTVRAQRLHIVGDLLVSIAVLVGGALVAFTHEPRWDPGISLCIVVFVAILTIRMMVTGDTHDHHVHGH